MLRFIPVKKYFRYSSGHTGNFPRLGLLTDLKIAELEKALGLKINKIELFEQALVHRSYLQVLDVQECMSNERLEFLGDAVLGLIVGDYLFSLHTNVLEGELTKMRSWLVNKNSLALCSRNLGLDRFLFLSFSAQKSLDSGSDSILADALEAIIAAIYIDSGLEATKDFVINSLIPMMMNTRVMSDRNYKSILLEEVQAHGHDSPIYEVLEESGPDHDKEFTVGVYVSGELVGSGKGKSKKQAEQLAAKIAIENNIYNENKSIGTK